MAFIAHQYCRLQDNLVDVLLSIIQSFQNSAQREHKERIYEQQKLCNKALPGLLSRLEGDIFGVLRQIRKYAHDDCLSDTEKITKIRSLLIDGKDDELMDLKTGLERELNREDYYEVLEARSLRLQNRVSPILKALSFQAEPSTAALMKAIEHFKSKDGVIKQTSPISFLRVQEHKVIVGADNQKFKVSLYKAFLFMHVANAIKSGNLRSCLARNTVFIIE